MQERQLLCLRPCIVAVLLAFFPLSGFAAALTWDTVTGDGGASTPGGGTWTTGAGNWNNGTGNVNWANGDTATFGGPDGAYTINLGGAITTGNLVTALTFSGGGYTLQAPSALNLNLGTTANTTAFIHVAAGKTAVIGDNISAVKATSGSLNLVGGGTLQIGSGTPGGGAVLQNAQANANEIRGGSTLEIRTGGTLTSATSVVLGSLTANENFTNRLIISGGSAAINSNNLVLGNNTAGQTSSAVLTVGAGTLNVAAATGTLRFGTTNAAAGTNTSATVHLNGGTLTVGRVFQGTESGGGVISSIFNFNGGTLRVQAGSTNAANYMSGLDQANIQAGGAILDSNGVNVTVAQIFQHDSALGVTPDGGLTKTGLGSLTLSGPNSYTGTTTVAAGQLLINGAHSGGGLITVSAGATLGGSGSAGDVDALAGARLSPGSAATPSDHGLLFGSLLLTGTTELDFDLDAPSLVPDIANSDFIQLGGSLRLDGVLNINPRGGFGAPAGGEKWLLMSYSGSLTDNTLTVGSAPTLAGGLFYAIDTNTSGSVFLSVVPEPATVGLLGVGLVLLLRRMRARA